MKKFTKITLWMTAILVVTGLGFLIAGTVTAGGTDVLKAQLRSGDLNFGNWHFDDGVYYKGDKEIDVADVVKDAMHLLPAGEEQITDEFANDITCIEIETDISNLTIKPSNTDKFVVNLEEGYTKYYEADVHDDTLIIRYDVKGQTFKQGPKIVVEVPKNQKLERIYIYTKLGEVNLRELEQETEELEIYSDLGNVHIEDCRMNGSCTVSAAMGNINIEDSKFKEADLNADMGNIDFSGAVTEGMNGQADMGSIDVELDGFSETYNIQLSTDMGSVVYEGEKQGNSFASYPAEAEAFIVLNCDMGEVELSFE